MNVPITFSGHHIEVTPALRDYAVEKLGRLERRGDHLISIAVTLGVNKLEQTASATVHVKGAEIHASAKSRDMYAAIDDLADKLKRQIEKHREGLTSHHGHNGQNGHHRHHHDHHEQPDQEIDEA